MRVLPRVMMKLVLVVLAAMLMSVMGRIPWRTCLLSLENRNVFICFPYVLYLCLWLWCVA